MPHLTTKHYNQEVDFFSGFLDPYMKYSSSIFHSDDETLDTAVLRMLDALIESGKIENGSRVLDVGNGWGCFLKRLIEVRNDVRYVGVNPSQVQLDYIAREIDYPALMHNAPVEDVVERLDGPFETIYLIGALCHIKKKVEVLKQLNGLLVDGGRMVLEDTFFLSEDLYQRHARRNETKFVQDEVFGFAHIYSLAHHFNDLREAGFRVMNALDNSDSYSRSIEIWTDRLSRMDPEHFPLAQTFVKYMGVAQRGWGYTICNHMMTLEKTPPRRNSQITAP